MIETNRVVLGILIILAFSWRFARTRQLYLTSLAGQTSGSDSIPFSPRDVRSFIDQALLGHRSLDPSSFFIRAIVFVLVSFCLLPFKHYDPGLFWLVIGLVILYAPYCIALGCALRKKIAESTG